MMAEEVQYFVSEMPETPLVLRRTGVATDEAFLNGKWQPTKIIIDYMFGHDDFVSDISEKAARVAEPDAFE